MWSWKWKSVELKIYKKLQKQKHFLRNPEQQLSSLLIASTLHKQNSALLLIVRAKSLCTFFKNLNNFSELFIVETLFR